MTAHRIPDASVLTNWRKSSYSGSENQNCVEVASADGCIATRDSKNPTGPALLFTQDAWTSFVRDVASGGFEDA
jgi:hypothetical protein